MNTALIFSHSGGTTTFYDDEVNTMEKDFIKEVDMFRVRDGFRGYNHDQGYYNLSISFQNKKFSDGTHTIDKIKDLFDLVDSSTYLPETMQLYYEYMISTSSNYYVQMKRDDYKKQLIAGEIPVNIMTINFIQTTPEGVAVRGPIIGA